MDLFALSLLNHLASHTSSHTSSPLANPTYSSISHYPTLITLWKAQEMDLFAIGRVWKELVDKVVQTPSLGPITTSQYTPITTPPIQPLISFYLILPIHPLVTLYHMLLIHLFITSCHILPNTLIQISSTNKHSHTTLTIPSHTLFSAFSHIPHPP